MIPTSTSPPEAAQSLAEARELSALLADLRELAADLTARRRQLVRELLASGMTYRQLATELGVSATRVHTIANPDHQPVSRDLTGDVIDLTKEN